MTEKYVFPNLKDFLKDKGIYLQDFYNAAFKVSDGRRVGNRTWAMAMNMNNGVTETTLNRMEEIATKAMKELKIEASKEALEKNKLVKQNKEKA